MIERRRCRQFLNWLSCVDLPSLITLECVPEAMTCQWVQSNLKSFCSATGFHVSQVILHLHSIWPARRSRWWCVLSHPMGGQGPVAPFPTMPQHQTVSNLLDSALNCSDDELRQLILDLYELGKFSHFGVHDNVIPWKGQMKTSLHSCGNQLSGCPCGCRKFPFTESRLAQGRLNGLPPF